MKRSIGWVTLVLICSAAPTTARGQTINGFVVDTPGCSVRVYRQLPWATDEISTVTDGRGYWQVCCDKLYGPLNPGNAFSVDYGWNLKRPMSLNWRRSRDTIEILPDVHLDQFTVCIRDVIDNSGIAGNLSLYYQLLPGSGRSFRPVFVDTGRTEDAFFDVHLSLPKYRIFSGSVLYLKLYKIFGQAQESLAYVDRSYDLLPSLNAQVLEDQVRFPERLVARQNQGLTGTKPTTAGAVAKRRTAPSRIIAAPSRSGDRPPGVLFDVLGRQIPQGEIARLRSGTYFVVIEDPPTVTKYIVRR